MKRSDFVDFLKIGKRFLSGVLRTTGVQITA
jgi:hypothetical protein